MTFLLSGLFVVWTFRVLFLLLFGRWRVSFFAVWAGAAVPAQTAKKKPKQQNHKHAPAPSERGFFLLFGRVVVFLFAVWAGAWGWACFFFALWAGGVLCFLLFGRVRVIFLLFGRVVVFIFCCVGGRVCVFFGVWAGGLLYFLLFGRVRVYVFSVWAGGVFFFAVWAG